MPKLYLRQNLGINDVTAWKKSFGIVVDPTACKAGCLVDITEDAYAAISKKYPALLETADDKRKREAAHDAEAARRQAEAIKGESKKPEITAPSK
jgi:hypothetical protein